TVDGDRERELDLAEVLAPRFAHRDRCRDRLEVLRLRPIGTERIRDPRAAGGERRDEQGDDRSVTAPQGAHRPRSRHLAASAPLTAVAEGWTPSRLSLASIRRR